MKFKIDNTELIEEFYVSTHIIGIVAPVKAYYFCWKLNQILKLDFRTNVGLEIQLEKKQRKYFFTIYSYTERNNTRIHYIYQNQNDGEYLLPELKHLDFLWLIQDEEMTCEELQRLQIQIRDINLVQLVSELSLENIKNKSHLIF
jgi:hypothetical protein